MGVQVPPAAPLILYESCKKIVFDQFVVGGT